MTTVEPSIFDDDVAYCDEPLTREMVTVEHHVACTTFWASEPDGTLYHHRVVLSEDIEADLDQFIADHNARFGLTTEAS